MIETKRHKKALAFLLAFVLVFAMVPTHSTFAEDGKNAIAHDLNEGSNNDLESPSRAAEALLPYSSDITSAAALRWSDTRPARVEWDLLSGTTMYDYRLNVYHDVGNGFSKAWSNNFGDGYSSTGNVLWRNMDFIMVLDFAMNNITAANYKFQLEIRNLTSDGDIVIIESPVYTYDISKTEKKYDTVQNVRWNPSTPYELMWGRVPDVDGIAAQYYIITYRTEGQNLIQQGTTTNIQGTSLNMTNMVTSGTDVFRVVAYNPNDIESVAQSQPSDYSPAFSGLTDEMELKWSNPSPGVAEWKRLPNTVWGDYKLILYIDRKDNNGFREYWNSSRSSGSPSLIDDIYRYDMGFLMIDENSIRGTENADYKFVVMANNSMLEESPIYTYDTTRITNSYATVQNIRWNPTNPYELVWDPVPSVDGYAPLYYIFLYENGNQRSTYGTNATSRNMSSNLTNGSATYTFRIVAYSSNIEKVKNSILSEFSPAFSTANFPYPAPNELGWEKRRSSTTVPAMTSIWNAHPGTIQGSGYTYRYEIEMYRNGSRVRSSTTTVGASGGTSQIVSSSLYFTYHWLYFNINESGSYTFRVRLLGSAQNEVLSPWSDFSAPYVFDANAVQPLDTPSNLRWATDASGKQTPVAEWDPVDNAAGYVVELLRTNKIDVEAAKNISYVVPSGSSLGSTTNYANPNIVSRDFSTWMTEPIEYTFRVRAISPDLHEFAHSNSYAISKTTYDLRPEESDIVEEVNNGLSELLNDVNATPQDILSGLTEMNTGNLTTVIQSDSDALNAFSELEEKYAGGMGITVNEVVDDDLGWAPGDVSIIGAAFNTNQADSTVSLKVDKLSTPVDDASVYKNVLVIKMTLEGVDDPGQLKVPVRVTLPIPAGFDDHKSIYIIHERTSGIEYIRQPRLVINEQEGTMSFALLGFSTFKIVEDKDNIVTPPIEPTTPPSGESGSNENSGNNSDSSSDDYRDTQPVASTQAALPSIIDQLKKMLENMKNVLIDLGKDDVLTFDGQLLSDVVAKRANLIITKDNTTITMTSEMIEAMRLNSAKKIEIGFKLVTDAVVNRTNMKDAQNEAMLKYVYDITITMDGKKLSDLSLPLTITYDLSRFRLNTDQKSRTTGIRIADNKTINQLGGEWRDKIFSFQTSKLSSYGIAISDNLVKVDMKIGNRMYAVNGRERMADTAAMLINDRTMVPVRFIAEAFGASVDWNSTNQTVSINLDGTSLLIPIGEIIPGMDIPAILYNERTYVPLRYVAERLGSNVIWNENLMAVTIYR